MDSDDFRNVAQGTQAILIAIGLLVAGMWALYRFFKLLSVDNAKVELERSNAELKKIHNELKDRPYISLKTTASVVGNMESEGSFIKVGLEISNLGNNSDVVDWTASSIKAALVTGWGDEGPLFGQTIESKYSGIEFEFAENSYWPGESSHHEFLLPLSVHGLYLVEVKIFSSSAEVVTEMKKSDEPYFFDSISYVDTRMVNGA